MLDEDATNSQGWPCCWMWLNEGEKADRARYRYLIRSRMDEIEWKREEEKKV